MGGRLYRDLPAPLRCEDSVEIDARVRTGRFVLQQAAHPPIWMGPNSLPRCTPRPRPRVGLCPPPVLITAAASGRSVPPTVLITAANLTFVRAAGADAILRKPFDLRDLRALIHRFLGGRSDQKGALE